MDNKDVSISQKAKGLRIVFMGTPAFAVASLEGLINAGLQVVAVVTSPDKPAGRGLQLHESPVKKFAVSHNIPVLQPAKLKDPGFLETLASYKADVQVVVAFRMLPELVWNMPPMGTVNVHASLLPQYRGAAPINWAIINGEAETGITTFKLQHAIDTGNILLQEKLSIEPAETAGELHDRLMAVGAGLIVQTITGLAEGTLFEQPQPKDDGTLKHAPKLFTETCRIDWNAPAQHIFNLVRGLSPYPGAFTTFDHKMLKIYACKIERNGELPEAGSVQSDGKTYLRFAANDGFISILDLQLEGKKRMDIESFLRGYRSSQPK